MNQDESKEYLRMQLAVIAADAMHTKLTAENASLRAEVERLQKSEAEWKFWRGTAVKACDRAESRLAAATELLLTVYSREYVDTCLAAQPAAPQPTVRYQKNADPRVLGHFVMEYQPAAPVCVHGRVEGECGCCRDHGGWRAAQPAAPVDSKCQRRWCTESTLCDECRRIVMGPAAVFSDYPNDRGPLGDSG